ncbi:hypothetical protein C8J56DRAFT_886994 [Mycena floridula]|nr:hypothetical protein C8J56DRAFT_886994 [Mycena floridula]
MAKFAFLDDKGCFLGLWESSSSVKFNSSMAQKLISVGVLSITITRPPPYTAWLAVNNACFRHNINISFFLAHLEQACAPAPVQLDSDSDDDTMLPLEEPWEDFSPVSPDSDDDSNDDMLMLLDWVSDSGYGYLLFASLGNSRIGFFFSRISEEWEYEF